MNSFKTSQAELAWTSSKRPDIVPLQPDWQQALDIVDPVCNFPVDVHDILVQRIVCFDDLNSVLAELPNRFLVNVLWKGVQIFDIVIKCRADLGVVLLNAVPDQAQVSNDPCIFVLIHFGIMLPIQLPPVKNLLGHADQIADFGNDHICTVWIHQAEKEMILMYNPAARATPPKAKAPTPDYYQPDQMDEILNALENAPLLWKTITYIMIDSGCRRGEALGLKWSSLELDTGLMVIENNLQYTKKTGIYLGPTKTGKVRALKLAPQCVELLKEWKLEQMRMRLKQGSDWKETGMVFTKDNGEWLHPDSITRWLNNFSRDNGLPHINPHAFRHTVASVLLANGTDIVTVSKQLGHASVNTTESFYSHIIEENKAKASECIADVLLRKKA